MEDDEDDHTAKLKRTRGGPARRVLPGIALGIAALAMLLLVAALFWSREPERRPPMAPLPRTTVSASPSEAKRPPPPVKEPTPDEREEQAVPASGTERTTVVFQAPRGTLISHGRDPIEANQPALLDAGAVTVSYKCPGKRQPIRYRTFDVRAPSEGPQLVALQCKSR